MQKEGKTKGLNLLQVCDKYYSKDFVFMGKRPHLSCVYENLNGKGHFS